MSLSLYGLSVPVLVRGLGIVSTYLDKAQDFAAEKGLDASEIIDARLYDDMLPFAGQIQRGSDTAKAAMGRLTGAETPSFPDTVRSFDETLESGPGLKPRP